MTQPQPHYRTYTARRALVKLYEEMEESIELQKLNKYCVRQNYDGLRVMFWNMHGFVETRIIYNYEVQLQSVLTSVQPDILALAEHNTFAPHDMLCRMFPYFHMHRNLAIYSKNPFQYITTIAISPGRYLSDYIVTANQTHLYLTHLDPCSQNNRDTAAKEILKYKINSDHADVILVGDFNQPDSREMSDKEQYITHFKSRTNTEYINIFEHFDQSFCDSFMTLGIQPPSSTHWTGTRIDFTFLTSNLYALRSYVYHTKLSDHLPVITDVASLLTNCHQNQR